MVESQPSKLLVAGSIPVSRSTSWFLLPGSSFLVPGTALLPAPCFFAGERADVAQLEELVLGKDEVTSSILVIGSTCSLNASGLCTGTTG